MGEVIVFLLLALVFFRAIKKARRNRRFNNREKFRDKQRELLETLREHSVAPQHAVE